MRNHPLTLCRLLDAAAPGWEGWEIEAVWDALRDLRPDQVDLQAPALPDLLGALQVLKLRPELFWSEWEVFENIAHALNGNTCDFTMVQPLSPAEAALAVALARRLEPRPMADEVKAYLEVILHAAGMSVGVGPLQDIVDRSAHPDRRRRALARYHELLAQGEDAVVEEVEPDVEAARMLAVTLYVRQHELEPAAACA